MAYLRHCRCPVEPATAHVRVDARTARSEDVTSSTIRCITAHATVPGILLVLLDP
jgi:hypothetical protein